MAKKPEKPVDPAQNSSEFVIRRFIAGLDDKHKMLVVLKAQLYGNCWEPMLLDLQNRLDGKPYIFKLANRIKDDVRRIKLMQNFEKQYGIDLSGFVRLDDGQNPAGDVDE